MPLIWKIRLFYLSTGLAGGVLTPYLSLLFQHNGLHSGQIGLVMAIGTAVTIVVQPLWGMFVDKTGKTRLALVLSVIVPALMAIIFNTPVLWLVALANGVYNLFTVPQGSIADSYAVSTARQTGNSYGSIRSFASLGFALGGYGAGLYLASLSVTTIWIPYVLLSLVAFLTAVSIPTQRNIAVSAAFQSGYATLLSSPSFLLFLAGGFLLSQTLTAFNTYFALTFQDIGGSMRYTGIAFLLASGTNVPAMLLAMRVMRRIGREKILLLASAVYVIRWGVQAFVPIPAVALAIQVLHGISFGFYYVVAVDFVSNAAPKGLQATAQSVFGMVCGGFAGIVGNLLNGYLLRFGGPSLMYTSCMVSALLGAVCFWGVGRIERRAGSTAPQ